MHLPWFRLYAEFGTDPVIQSLAFEDQRHYVILLCLKASGVLDRKVFPAAKERIIYRALGLDPVAGYEAKRRLMDVSLVTEKWQIPGWNKRQFQSDLSAERTRKYRKSKASENVTRRHGDGAVTPQIRSDQRGSYAPSDAEFKKQNSLSCTELPAKGAGEAHVPNGSGVFLQTCRRGEEWEVPEAKLVEWKEAYPDVNIRQTLIEIRQWLRDNPGRRKTARGMTKFVGAWMLREQDKPETGGTHGKSTHH